MACSTISSCVHDIDRELKWLALKSDEKVSETRCESFVRADDTVTYCMVCAEGIFDHDHA